MNLTTDPNNLFLLEELAEHTDKAFFIFDVSNQKLNYLSPAFELIWEMPRTAFQNDFSRIFRTVLPDDRAYVMRNWFWYKRPRESNKKTCEFRIMLPDERVKWVTLEMYLVRNEDLSYCLTGWLQEITERKNFMEVLKKYAARKNSTLEILSHDIAGFIGLIQNLSKNIGNNPATRQDPEINHQLELIHQTCLQCSNLIINLVNHEFVESSSVPLKRSRLDLVLKIGDVIEMFRGAEQGLGKNFEIRSSQPAILAQIDEVKFMQVINNLLSNAIKFTPDGGSIRIYVEDRVESVMIQVSDSGIGIPEEFQPVLFDRFTPATRPGLRGEKSVGLGMSIIKAIIEAHGGKIWFNSQENQGTTFFIEMPKE